MAKLGPLARAMDWESTARTNPNVGIWWSQMPESRHGEDVVEFMKRDKRYNYRKAIETGRYPTYQKEHNQYRWISDDPALGTGK